MREYNASGHSTNNIDSKNRVFFPAKLREELGAPVVVTVSKDGCLEAYSMEEWQSFMSKLRALPKNQKNAVLRIFSGMSQKCEYDASGRITLTDEQIKYADIKKGITFVGCAGTVELWAEEKAPLENITPEDVADVSRIFDEFGI